MGSATHQRVGNMALYHRVALVCLGLALVALAGCSAPAVNVSDFADIDQYIIEVDQFGRYRVQYPDGTYTKVRFPDYPTAFAFVWVACEMANEELSRQRTVEEQEKLDKQARWKPVRKHIEHNDQS